VIENTAVISKKAKLASSVEIGPYSIIGDDAVIGDGCRIGAHCVIEGKVTMGKNCQVFTGAVVGSPPQDLKYKGQESYLEIGNDNIIREYVTINPGTDEGSKTIIGNDNLFMAYSHVAHDCVIENGVRIANVGTLAGHVHIEDNVVIGGLVAVHQFCRVGRHSIIGGCSKVVQDIPPYSTCDGHPAEIYSVNIIGLKRNKTPRHIISDLKKAFKIAFFSKLSSSSVIEKLNSEFPTSSEVQYLINFIKNSQRGLCRSVKTSKKGESV